MQQLTQSVNIFLFSIILTLFVFGCSEPTFVGNELVIDGQEFNTDTAVLPVLIYPEKEDSLASNTGLSAVSVGIVNSPYFGKNKSGFFTQATLSANGIRFGDNAVFDSMVLRLNYLAVLGDSMGMHDIKVYEVTEDIVDSTVLYSNQTFAYDPDPIGEKNGHIFNNVDDVILGTDTVEPHFRVRLSDALGARFMAENKDTLTTTFNTDDDFLPWFKGIYVTVDDANSTENSMAFFNPVASSVYSQIIFYYSVYSSDTTHTSFSFPITANSKQQIHFETDYSGSGIEALLNEPDSINEFSALAPMAGVNTIIEIPGLDAYSGTLINKAELIIPVLPFEDIVDTLYNRPTETSMFWKKNGELSDQVQDMLSSGTLYNYEGGLVTDDVSGIDFYRMNLAASVQELAMGQRDSSVLILYQSPRRAAIRRVLLGGGAHPDPQYRARLNLYYTDID